MGVTSETQIMNSALIKLGADRINSPDDATSRAILCKERYPILRDALIRMHPWNFSTSFVEFAQITPKPTAIWKYGYAFQIPADCERIFETSLNFDDPWEKMSDGYVVCDVSEFKAKIGKKVTDVTKFDSVFCEVLAIMLAADIGYAITQNAAMVEALDSKFARALAQARAFDGQEGSVRQVVADDWITARN